VDQGSRSACSPALSAASVHSLTCGVCSATCHLHSDSAATVHSSHCGVCSLCVMQVVDGAVRVTGDSRVYLVQDHRAPSWEHHQ
jgi:hypothetical protein